MKGLDGKTAIVSGGATLIGESCASVLAGYGVNVVIADINEADGKQRRRAASAPSAAFIRTDITSDADIAALVAATVERHGRLDFLVNVACTYLDNGAETARADWLKALRRQHRRLGDADAGGAAASCKKNKGAIVNFGSISARVAQVGRWVYPVSKAAILQLTRNQALDLAPDGIRVNAVSPGWTWSNIMKQLTQRQPRQDRRGRRALPSAAAARAIRRRSPRRWRSCCPMRRASSPAPTSGSTAATRRSAPSGSIRRSRC